MRTNVFTRSFTRSRTILTLWYIVFCFALIALFNFGAFSAQESSIEPIRSINYGVNAPALGEAGVAPKEVSTTEIDATIDDVRKQFGRTLIIVDGVLIIFSVAFSYILSGITLRPIRKALEDQEEFAQEVSHELRTPLSVMDLEIEALKRADANLASKHASALANITAELKRMNGLVDGLLSLVHPYDASERIKITGVPFDIAVAVESAFLQLQKLAEAKNITYSFKSHFKGKITGHENDIKQVITILLDNAIKYTPDGGSVSLVVQPSPDKRNVLITVKDTGKGISKTDLPRVFNRFYRSKARNVQDIDGLGLGLAIAQKRIEFHHGNIEIESTPDKGTVIQVSLPIRP